MSATDPAAEENTGARHQAESRRRLKTATSKTCPHKNAAPEAPATRPAASKTSSPPPAANSALAAKDSGTPKINPAATTRPATRAPAARFTQSVTKNAKGYEKCPQVSQSFSGSKTRQFDTAKMPAIAAAPARNAAGLSASGKRAGEGAEWRIPGIITKPTP